MARSAGELEVLWRRALYLRRHGPKRKGASAYSLPALWFFTDPDRVADPLAAAARLPAGCGIVYRGFGRPQAPAEAAALARLAREKGLVFLVGLDGALAAQVGAHGVHLPERHLGLARRLKVAHPGWILTGAARGAGES